MNRKSLFKFSIISLIIGVIVLAIAYFIFHFVTDDGITLVFHEEACKPFVTFMVGIFGVLFLFASAVSCLSALIFFPKDK